MAKTEDEPRKFRSHSAKERGGYCWWLYKGARTILNVQVFWRSRLTGLWISRDYEGKWSGSVGLYWLYATIGIRLPHAACRGYGDGRQISLTAHDGRLYWKVWVDPDSWSSSRSKWRDGSFCPLDAVLGRRACTQRAIETRDVLIPMPERSYQATASLVEFIWKRPRSPFSKRVMRVSIDVPGGIPHAGKGENSWDCGDDATFGITTGECRSIPEGVGKLVGSCLSTRVRHGGWDDYTWKRGDELPAPSDQGGA